MSKKNITFLAEATDSMIVGALACSIFKGIALILKLICLILFWPFFLLMNVRSMK